MTLSIVELPENKAHIRIDGGIYVATDVPLDVAEAMVRAFNYHDTLINNLQVCRDALNDLATILGHQRDAEILISKLDKCLKAVR